MKRCALCSTSGLEPLFTLPKIPLSHHLRKSSAEKDPRFDLVLAICPKCGLLQIANPIDAATIYGDGADTYTTAFQKPRHLDDLITTVIARQDPGNVLDVGCNDGALMDALKRHGYRAVVGLEPNLAAVKIARQNDHTAHFGYLDHLKATTLLNEHGQFDTVFCRHVIEHVADIGAFMRAIRTVLRDDGLLVLELPVVEEALGYGNPAILWEEHVSYLTDDQAQYMLGSFGFEITDRRNYAFGGGSVAYVARKKPTACIFGFRPDLAPMGKMLAAHFVEKMEAHKSALFDLVVTARANGYQVAMYGAAPRSVMVAAVCGIAGMIDVVVDDRADLWGRLMPGTDRTITHLGACKLGPRVLCLLGVGAESEHKVKPRMPGAVFVSLFPPRDTLASIEAARKSVIGPDAGKSIINRHGEPAKVAA